ncbi:hypothetical protein [Paractinoplanes rishiriensis]|uniref:Uncharacterized protein n=1 Tax=Paractinoplanes rishiriensis TaxID=1050105 RepID=A0A919K9G8_9ACTN|nr:hypothetical protein [Actinoplanes rishiriensis]GIF02210.1 hypothetical protein Ari01nite_96740 [Actinoplanes rishiriensis]
MLRRLVRRQRRGSARWAAAAATLALTAAIGLTVASPAHAETLPITDSFSSGLWTTQGVSGRTSAHVGSFGGPRTGPDVAYLDAYPLAPAEAKVFRSITLNNGAPLPTTCQASVWVDAVSVPSPPGVPLPPVWLNVQMHLRVHSGGPTGRIISVRGNNIVDTGWKQRHFNPIPWPADSRTITIEITAYRGIGVADDFSFSC